MVWWFCAFAHLRAVVAQVSDYSLRLLLSFVSTHRVCIVIQGWLCARERIHRASHIHAGHHRTTVTPPCVGLYADTPTTLVPKAGVNNSNERPPIRPVSANRNIRTERLCICKSTEWQLVLKPFPRAFPVKMYIASCRKFPVFQLFKYNFAYERIALLQYLKKSTRFSQESQTLIKTTQF